jgi:acyl-CoA thioester hydrolase
MSTKQLDEPSGTRPNPVRVSVELEVPFHDVDSLQVVWHGHYYKYFEIARTALFRRLGIDRRTFHLPYTWVVIETQCRHAQSLRFGDRFRVDSWLRDIDHRVHVAYEIYSITAERRAARGHTMFATLDADGSLLLNTPEPLLRLLRA